MTESANSPEPQAVPADGQLERQVLRKVSLRLLPFLCLLYIVNILDRGNVAFAKLQMLNDLGIDEGTYALGAGIFFIGYSVLEVPSNLILSRIGARLWIARIMVTWGLITSAMMLMTGPWTFMILRFLLGCAEAGFFPGILLYLTYWYPKKERARAVAVFMVASPVATIAGAPLSGALLEYANGLAGLAGWQWLFLIEGVPAVILGVIVLFYLTDRPAEASWLTAEERSVLAAQLQGEEQPGARLHVSFSQFLEDRRVWLLILLYSINAAGISALANYLPTLLKQRFPGRSEFDIGLLAAVPSICTMLAMVVVAVHSDRTGERRWHVAGPIFLAAAGWATAAWVEAPLPSLVCLTLALVGMMSAMGPFWSLATSFLSGRAAAGGIALINAIGNLGGFVGPNIIGQFQSDPPDYPPRLVVVALLLIGSGCLALCARQDASSNRAL